MKKTLTIILIISISICSQAQKIGDMKSSVSEGKSSSSSSDGGDSDDLGFYLAVQMFQYSFQALFGFGDEDLTTSPDNGGKGFNRFPYADGEKGKYSPYEYKNQAGEISLHYFTENYDISGIYLKTRLAPVNFFDVQFDLMNMVETVSETEQYRITNASVIANFNRIQGGRCNLWWGIGAYFWNNVSEVRPIFQIGTDVWIKKPVSVEVNAQFTGVNGVPITNFQAKLAYHVHRFAGYAGYQGFSVGKTGINSWMVGSSLYF